MKYKLLFSLSFGFVVTFPSHLAAEEKKLSTEIEVGTVLSDGRRDSAKAEEYRDLSNGPTAGVKLKYSDKTEGDYAQLTAENVDREDLRTVLNAGRYGQYKLDMTYDQTPHRLAYGAQSVYSGIGSGVLTLPEDKKNEITTAKDSPDLVAKLNSLVDQQARSVDLETMRKTWKAKAEYLGLESFKFKVDVSTEKRDGKRPSMGSFGFGNVVELVQPIDYNTSQTRFSADYTQKGLYLAANYYLSVFQNDSNSFSYDNPFRSSDSTSADAYTNPKFVNTVLVNSGASRGLVSLAPDNLFHGPTISASISDLPWNSRINLSGSLGWMVQDDSFVPYTSNSAVTGTDGARSFAASDSSNLPVNSADASVSTTLYSLGASSHPLNWLDTSIKYRYYDYSNDSDQLTFPGYVRFDSTWIDQSITTQPTSYNKQNASFDVGFKLPEQTRLGLYYRYDDTHREHREVANQSENTLGSSIDHRISEELSLKASYEKSFRHASDYDASKAYVFGSDENERVLPLLRKYYEASREMDSIHFLATVTPEEDLDISAGFLYSNSNFDKSAFGLLDDRSYQLSTDADYVITKWLTMKGSYSYEHHSSSQAGRQWSSGGLGDPFLVDNSAFSLSNWQADSEDFVHTIGAAATLTLIAKELFFDLSYSYAIAQGNMDFTSPLGDSNNDANPFVADGFNQVDNSTDQRINPTLRYRVTKDVTVSLGYLWERFCFSDDLGQGYTAVPTTSSGDYNGALLSGIYPYKNYTINVGYLNLKYKF